MLFNKSPYPVYLTPQLEAMKAWKLFVWSLFQQHFHQVRFKLSKYCHRDILKLASDILVIIIYFFWILWKMSLLIISYRRIKFCQRFKLVCGCKWQIFKEILLEIGFIEEIKIIVVNCSTFVTQSFSGYWFLNGRASKAHHSFSVITWNLHQLEILNDTVW